MKSETLQLTATKSSVLYSSVNANSNTGRGQLMPKLKSKTKVQSKTKVETKFFVLANKVGLIL